jgi:hypothetical protein
MVDPSERGDDIVDAALDRVPTAHVERESARANTELRAQQICRAIRVGQVDVADGDGAASLRECARAGEADPAPSTGDEADSILMLADHEAPKYPLATRTPALVLTQT